MLVDINIILWYYLTRNYIIWRAKMKKMHKILSLILALIMLMSTLVSCDIISGILGGGPSDGGGTGDSGNKPYHEHVYVDGKCECGRADPSLPKPHTHMYFDGVCECGHVNPDYQPPHEHNFVNGECACGEKDPNYNPPHEHNYVNGECSCGVKDPNYNPPHEHNYVNGECSCGVKDPNYNVPHACESECSKCDGCLDAECTNENCLTKCEGHAFGESGYGYLPIISSVMPAIYINTPNGDNSWATRYNRGDKLAGNIDYVDATISTTMCEDEYIITDLEAEVKVRGNYTLEYAKKPIRIKFSKKQNLLGLHEGEKYKNWVLLADWKDLSMSNNSLAFYLGNAILGSDGYYCTDFRNVEVYLNGQYWGVYLLVEQQEAKDDRSSVPEVEDDYTGNDIGYLFEYDGYYTDERNMADGDPTFEMDYRGASFGGGIGYTLKSDIYADSQLQFLKSYMDNAYHIIYQATKGNFYEFDENYQVVKSNKNNAKDVIAEVVNLDSLVGTYILNELACDPDVGWSSFYLSLDMSEDGDKKITFEAPWDFDSSFGIRHIANGTTGFFAQNHGNPWFSVLAGQSWFFEMVCEKWAEMKEYGVLDNAIWLIESQKVVYKDYYTRNYNRWSDRIRYGNDEVVGELNALKDANTAQGHAADYLINWLEKRIAWLDERWTVIEDTTPPIPDEAESYIYEAENANLIGFVADAVRNNRDYASGNAYVGRVDNGTSISFTVTASEATTAHLCAGISKRNVTKEFSSLFSVTVNGKAVAIPMRYLPAISGGEEDWHSFISLMLTTIQLEAGENTIVFTTISSDAANFDFIELYSLVPLQ